jgi:hypothetical protein
LDHAEREVKRRQRLPSDISQLSDDVLCRCLFSGGYLDSIETARLRGLSKRMRRLASQQVQRLDLRNCHRLTKEDVANIVTSFPNLTVRTVGSIQAMILSFFCSKPILTCLWLLSLSLFCLDARRFLLLAIWRGRVGTTSTSTTPAFGSQGYKSR